MDLVSHGDTVAHVQLIGRGAEKQALRELLDSVRAGRSRALVLRGEPGVGKSALLSYAMAHADDMHVVRVVAVESETHLGFAAAHQLLRPFLPGLDRLPEPQRKALSAAFGLVSGPQLIRSLLDWRRSRCSRTRHRRAPFSASSTIPSGSTVSQRTSSGSSHGDCWPIASG